MKILVATNETQGQRKNDFSWTEEGELLHPSFECDGEKVDGPCGCKRSLCGVKSMKATTTMKVVDDPEATEETVREQIAESLRRGGWIGKEVELTFAEKTWVAEDAEFILEIAAGFPAGTVIERRGKTFRARRKPN